MTFGLFDIAGASIAVGAIGYAIYRYRATVGTEIMTAFDGSRTYLVSFLMMVIGGAEQFITDNASLFLSDEASALIREIAGSKGGAIVAGIGLLVRWARAQSLQPLPAKTQDAPK